RRRGRTVGVNSATASWITSRKVRIRIRTLTSHASQFRSSNVDCILVPMLWLMFWKNVRRLKVSRTVSPPAVKADCRRLGDFLIASTSQPNRRLASQLGDHGEQRHVERNHNT